MFLVMILVTSWRSSFSLSKLEDAAFAVRVSRYSRAVFDMNVSAKRCYNTWGMRGDSTAHQNQQMRTVSVLFQPLDHMCLQTPLRARLGMKMPICEDRICPLL